MVDPVDDNNFNYCPCCEQNTGPGGNVCEPCGVTLAARDDEIDDLKQKLASAHTRIVLLEQQVKLSSTDQVLLMKHESQT